ncbi:hypothetical protein LUZ63_016600 [Rhynchospora breviuscula]|uniref:F-box domain-containing protein n=1 Tax=Rhynchospora breviuscula TaxID=2022672 RepID=A0A9P9ZA61_9POAL|nr:hypothetical protein LUZ63_016600 [Rhynchospora breviuscula]
MAFSQFNYCQRLNRFNSNQAGKRDREEDNNGEKEGILTYFRRKRANAKLLANERRMQRECNRDGGGGGISFKEGGSLIPVNNETKLAHGSSPHSTVNWHLLNFDMRTEVAKHTGGKEMTIISSVSQWFKKLVSQDDLWKLAFLRDMKIPVDCCVIFPWKEIYGSAFNGSHSFSLRHEFGHAHIARIRHGAFYLTSRHMLLTHTLSIPSTPPPVGILFEYSVAFWGMCILDNAKTGIWISDQHKLHCPWSDITRGVVDVLDARHLELFLEEGLKNGTWQYEDIAFRIIPYHCVVARGGIFNLARMWSPPTFQIFSANTWAGIPSNAFRTKRSLNAVAFSATLEQNLGMLVRYQVMKNDKGEAVSIRIFNYVI